MSSSKYHNNARICDDKCIQSKTTTARFGDGMDARRYAIVYRSNKSELTKWQSNVDRGRKSIVGDRATNCMRNGDHFCIF